MNNFTEIYKCTVKNIDGAIRFFVTFNDINCITHEIEIDKSVYEEFQYFTKMEKRQQNHFDRHIEHKSLTAEELEKRSFSPIEETEEIVIKKLSQDALHTAVKGLSKIQQRRIILYYEYNFSYEKIAKIENCSKVAVMVSVKRAKEKLSSMLEEYFKEI